MKSALLVIDVQRGFFDPVPRPFEAEDVVDRINELAGRARAGGGLVVYLQHEDPADDMVHGSERWQLHGALIRGEADQYLRKTTPDSFLRTELSERLASTHIERVVICGYASEACIDSTTRRGASLGFGVVLVSDAHTTHDASHASAAEIRTHHNAVLGGLWFGARIEVLPAAAVTF